VTRYKYSACRPAKDGFYKVHNGIHEWAAFYDGRGFNLGPRLTKNHSCMFISAPEDVEEWSEWEDE